MSAPSTPGIRDAAVRPRDLIDAGSLLSLRDIHDADACAALQEMRDEIAEREGTGSSRVARDASDRP